MADLAIPYAVTEPSILTNTRVWRSLTTFYYFSGQSMTLGPEI